MEFPNRSIPLIEISDDDEDNETQISCEEYLRNREPSPMSAPLCTESEIICDGVDFKVNLFSNQSTQTDMYSPNEMNETIKINGFIDVLQGLISSKNYLKLIEKEKKPKIKQFKNNFRPSHVYEEIILGSSEEDGDLCIPKNRCEFIKLENEIYEAGEPFRYALRNEYSNDPMVLAFNGIIDFVIKEIDRDPIQICENWTGSLMEVCVKTLNDIVKFEQSETCRLIASKCIESFLESSICVPINKIYVQECRLNIILELCTFPSICTEFVSESLELIKHVADSVLSSINIDMWNIDTAFYILHATAMVLNKLKALVEQDNLAAVSHLKQEKNVLQLWKTHGTSTATDDKNRLSKTLKPTIPLWIQQFELLSKQTMASAPLISLKIVETAEYAKILDTLLRES